MKPFTKKELSVVSSILLVVIIVTLFNLRISIRRARDVQRMADLGTISDALYKFNEDYGFFPPSENGEIKACKGKGYDEKINEFKKKKELDRNELISVFSVCGWGIDSLKDWINPKNEPYLKVIPSDPFQKKGIEYIYISNTKRFQLYAFLEGGEDQTGYDESIIKRNLSCGVKICNFGKSSGSTPLDKSIEEYELQLNREQNPDKP